MSVFLLVLVGLLTVAAPTQAQTTDFATGLTFPVKLLALHDGSLLASESGPEPNTGRVSIVNPNGVRRSLLEGLPSGRHAFPDGPPLGPAGLALDDHTLYLCIGDGSLVVPGAAPGTQAPNPEGPPSPITSSILKITLASDIARITKEFTFTAEDYTRLSEGHALRLNNGAGDYALVQMLTQFRYFVRDPFLAIRQANPHSLVIEPEKGTLYVADSGMDELVKVDTTDGRKRTLVNFPRIINPAGNPPTLDSVPNSVRAFGNQLLVSSMSGAPFLPGLAAIHAVDPRTGGIRPIMQGLTGAVDVLPQRRPGGRYRLLVAEFTTGKLLAFEGGVTREVVGNLTTPTNMVLDPLTDDLFVAEFETGKIVRVKLD